MSEVVGVADPGLVRVEICGPTVLHPLRLRVLRPGQLPSSVDHEHDYWPDTFHVGAFDSTGAAVGCATFYPEPSPTGRIGWRLRAMATAPEVRGKGYGAKVLRRGIDEIRLRGGDFLWCNARKGAVWFYQRLGFVTVSEEFEIAPIGPHYVMEIDLVTGLTDRNGQKVNTSNATAEPPPSR